MKKFKDGLPKYYNITLNFYIVVLFILLIIKLMGFDYFGIDVNNEIIVKFNNFLNKGIFIYIFQFLYLLFQVDLITKCIVLKKEVFKTSVKITAALFLLQIIPLFESLELLYPIMNFLLFIIVIKKQHKHIKLKNIFLFLLFNSVIQILTILIRIDSYNILNYIQNIILSFDYLIVLLIVKNISLEKGGYLWDGYQAFSSLQKWTLLKKFPTNFLERLNSFRNEFKKLNKQEKISYCMYVPLALIYNIITLLMILFVANLNDTVVECLFILVAFLSTKTYFGKPFHTSVVFCFIVSNLSYYALNRITTPIGISILVPIILGISLSYATSFLVKEKSSTKLYRGMSEELFEELILKVIDKNSTYYNVCKDFYINKYSELKLANKYHYTINGIKKIKTKIRDKLKEL